MQISRLAQIATSTLITRSKETMTLCRGFCPADIWFAPREFKASFVPPVSECVLVCSPHLLAQTRASSLTRWRQFPQDGSWAKEASASLPQVGSCSSVQRTAQLCKVSAKSPVARKQTSDFSVQYLGLGLSDPAVVRLLPSLSRCSFSRLANGLSSVRSENSWPVGVLRLLFCIRQEPALGRHTKHEHEHYIPAGTCWRLPSSMRSRSKQAVTGHEKLGAKWREICPSSCHGTAVHQSVCFSPSLRPDHLLENRRKH